MMILFINVIIIVGIFIYMKYKKNLLIFYKVNKNVFINLYVIVCLHFYFEEILQNDTFVCFDITAVNLN